MRKVLILILLAVVAFSFCGCKQAEVEEKKMSIEKESYGKADGREVMLYTLTNANGLVAKITNYGGIVTELLVPDKDGKLGDIVLGYGKLDDYVKETPYFGALIGRYGNRIGKGKFTLDGKEYQLATNDNNINHLHGGVKGFDKVVWDAKEIKADNGVGLELNYLSKDMEEGYPGNLKVKVIYMLTNDNELTVEYKATTDKTTVANLTQHNYYNLGGHDSGPILGHLLMLNADSFTPTDEGLIPTGEIRSVEGTPMDFRKPTAIGARITAEYEPLKFGGGYDHNWVLNKDKQGELSLAAEVYEPNSGRVMEIWTTQPAIQFYSGNFLDGSNVGKGGVAYQHRTAFCLETQHYPDSPNNPNFPSTVLKPGETYTHKTVHKFFTK